MFARRVLTETREKVHGIGDVGSSTACQVHERPED
jgi:hypothetical protein